MLYMRESMQDFSVFLIFSKSFQKIIFKGEIAMLSVIKISCGNEIYDRSAKERRHLQLFSFSRRGMGIENLHF